MNSGLFFHVPRARRVVCFACRLCATGPRRYELIIPGAHRRMRTHTNTHIQLCASTLCVHKEVYYIAKLRVWGARTRVASRNRVRICTEQSPLHAPHTHSEFVFPSPILFRTRPRRASCAFDRTVWSAHAREENSRARVLRKIRVLSVRARRQSS